MVLRLLFSYFSRVEEIGNFSSKLKRVSTQPRPRAEGSFLKVPDADTEPSALRSYWAWG